MQICLYKFVQSHCNALVCFGVSWSDLCVWLSLSKWVSETPFWNLTDVTLADQETNLILTDKANRVIQGNVAMQLQVTQPGGQLWKWCHAPNDPGIASITWIISPAIKQANSLERKIQVKHFIGSNFGQMTFNVIPALVLNLLTRWRHLKIQIEHSIGSNFGH